MVIPGNFIWIKQENGAGDVLPEVDRLWGLLLRVMLTGQIVLRMREEMG